MFYHAIGSNVSIGNTQMEYISFGNGKKNLILIPGVGDGLRTVKGTANSFAIMYRIFANDYKVYMFSRKNELERDCTTRSMAADLKKAMDLLQIDHASILGVSQGGMIAQYVAIDYPEKVDKLILAVTLSKPNDTSKAVISNWLTWAKADQFREIMEDTFERSYTEKYLKKYRALYPLLAKMTKPKSLERFILQAQACYDHNAYEELDKICNKTLIIGGECDKILSVEGSKEIAAKITDSELFIYEGLSHGAYEEAKDFNTRVLTFLKK